MEASGKQIEPIPLSALIVTDNRESPAVLAIETVLRNRLGWYLEYSLRREPVLDLSNRAWRAGSILTDLAMMDIILFDVACSDPVVTGPIRNAVDMLSIHGILNCRGFDWYMINDALVGDATEYLSRLLTRKISGIGVSD